MIFQKLNGGSLHFFLMWWVHVYSKFWYIFYKPTDTIKISRMPGSLYFFLFQGHFLTFSDGGILAFFYANHQILPQLHIIWFLFISQCYAYKVTSFMIKYIVDRTLKERFLTITTCSKLGRGRGEWTAPFKCDFFLKPDGQTV